MQHSFVWCDCETTGLVASEDLLLEVSVVLADDSQGGDCKPLDCYSAVVKSIVARDSAGCHVTQGSRTVTLNGVVQRMHEKNGLLGECHGDSALPLRQVDDELHAWLVARGCNRGGVLAGNSVHFDLGFIKVHLPKVARLLSHRVGDVTAMRLGWEAATGGVVQTEMPADHRAVDDIVGSLQTYAELRRLWGACS